VNRFSVVTQFLPVSWRSLVILPLSISLLACSFFGGDKRPEYQGAEYYKNLEVPPDLTKPDTRDAVTVPDPTTEALQRFRDNNKLDTIVTPKFNGVRVVNYAGSSWLEIDNNADKVWSELLKFWENEGIKIVQARPLLGFMETDWVKRLGGEKGFFSSLFQRFEPDQKDKFRVRLERFDNNTKTRLFVSHARIEREVSGEFADEFSWKTLPSDVEAEREIISRMALYAGLSKTQTTAMLENYRPYASLVKVDSANATRLTMAGSMDFVWRRAMRALDRLGMENIVEQKTSNRINFSVVKLKKGLLKVEEDELSKTSWLMQWFTGTDENVSSQKDRQYSLAFTELKDRIQIDVVDNKQTLDVSEDGDVGGTALAEQLRNLLVDKLE